jgi:hypothetical protein
MRSAAEYRSRAAHLRAKAARSQGEPLVAEACLSMAEAYETMARRAELEENPKAAVQAGPLLPHQSGGDPAAR